MFRWQNSGVQTQARVSEWDACKKYSDHSFHYHFYLYSIVDVVFPFIFLFRDVILTQSMLGWFFFFALGGRACRKAWCCMWKRDFWHCGTPTSRAELSISSLMDFLRRQWNIQLRHESVALDVCVRACVCACVRFVWQRSVCWLFSSLPPSTTHIMKQKPYCCHFCLYSQWALNFKPGVALWIPSL